jgi:hypothetical protein
MDITLQWATYRDASDQCSLSRIWGGIHPPADDIPGRKIGIIVGNDAFGLAEQYFTGQITSIQKDESVSGNQTISIFPNPVRIGNTVKLQFQLPVSNTIITLYNVLGQVVTKTNINTLRQSQDLLIKTNRLSTGLYFVNVTGKQINQTQKLLVIK